MKSLVGIVPEGIRSYLQDGLGNDSLKRLVSWMAATTLGILGYGLLVMMAYQVGASRTIDTVLRDCFIAVVGFIATLAMVAYRKPEAPGGPPDAPAP